MKMQILPKILLKNNSWYAISSDSDEQSLEEKPMQNKISIRTYKSDFTSTNLC